MTRHFLRPSLAFVFAAALLLPTVVSAQWVRESYPLKAGWNAIWLSQDCSVGANDSTRAIGDVLSTHPQIVEVWRWNPLGSTVQFIQAPTAPIKPDANWAVWRRGDPGNSTLGTLTGNSAYLVNVAPGTSAFTLQLTGKPLAPDYSFSSSGLNFQGFPTQAPDSSTLRNFETFFSFSPVLKSNPSVFFYNGGPLSDVNPKNPLQLSTPRFTPVSRGKAYWVKSAEYSDYYGPLKVTVFGSGGIEFGRKLNTVTVRVKNVTDPLKGQSVTATFSLANSLAAPGDNSPVLPVPLRARGERDSNLQFTYAPLPATITLAPGQEKDLVLDANRAQMNIAGQSYQSILQVSDSLNHTRIDLPVSATGSSQSGVWIGAAVLNSVNRVETISGPEFDAPTGTPDSTGPETQSLANVITTTGAGVTTRTTRSVVDFDADGFADLSTTGISPANVSLTSVTDNDPTTPDFTSGLEYTVGASNFAAVTDPGSGYTSPPEVSFSSGAATATATLSASVRRVKMTDGGSGYRNQPLGLSFSGGEGSGAEGFVTLDGAGSVVGVTLTHGGNGYTSAPAIEFPPPLDGGAAATGTAVITGDVVTGVTINSGGSGYVAPMVVTFVGSSTTAAAGFAVVSEGGIVTDVFITHGGSGFGAPPDVLIAGGGGSGAVATAEISGGIGKVRITAAGGGYAQAPTLVFQSVDGAGSGAAATVTVSADGAVSGVDRIQKVNNLNGPIGSRALVSVSSSTPTPPGTPDGTSTAAVLSTSQLVTLNGKSRLVTRRVSSGGDAAAPSNFPIRLILHAPASGAPTLLQQVFLGERDGVAYAGTSESALSKIVTSPGKMGRSSSASFPLAGKWSANSGAWGSITGFTVLLGHNAPTNPFLHSYHPDHDNWDARFERPLANKQESYTVERKITLAFSPTPPAGISEPGWGVTTLGGSYTETFTGLRAQEISVSGAFILHQVSEAAALIETP